MSSLAKNEHLLERILSTLYLSKFLFDHFRTLLTWYIHGVSKKSTAVLQRKIFNISHFLRLSDRFFFFLLRKNLLQGALMQIWKYFKIFVFIWKKNMSKISHYHMWDIRKLCSQTFISNRRCYKLAYLLKYLQISWANNSTISMVCIAATRRTIFAYTLLTIKTH